MMTDDARWPVAASVMFLLAMAATGWSLFVALVVLSDYLF